jgi:uroporphyrinogen decarboxylase
VPSIVFTKGGGAWLEAIAECGCDGVGLDWTQHIGQARARIGHRCALQGNLDPAVLLGPDAVIQSESRRVLEQFGPLRDADGACGGHVFNLGHGISRFTPEGAVETLVDSVHQHSRSLRR